MISRNFILAGRAIFTLDIPASFLQQHPELKPHYTFRVGMSKPDDRYPVPAYFVSLLAGPDNTSDYQYIGKLDRDHGTVTLTAKSKFTDQTWPVRLLRRVMAAVWYDLNMPHISPPSIEPTPMARLTAAGFVLHHEGRCGRCGRTLTVPESITSGFGPECITLIGK
jgi:hypothetical protein